jgi:hypothetical protein
MSDIMLLASCLTVKNHLTQCSVLFTMCSGPLYSQENASRQYALCAERATTCTLQHDGFLCLSLLHEVLQMALEIVLSLSL